jgi:N-acetyl sugar amidotransferase
MSSKNKNGLPLEIKYCKKCNLINQRPTSVNEYFHVKDTNQVTVQFDKEGICAACNYVSKEFDETIDWVEREKELQEICDKYRKNNGEYDCIVPGSGGKDSVFASHILKYKFKMNPLTVTWSPHMYTEVGWNNFQNWLHKGGFDNYLYTPNPKIHRKITREATLRLLHPFQPFIIGQKTFALKIAAKLNIHLVFYGESGAKTGRKISHKAKDFGSTKQSGFEVDPLMGKKFTEAYLGGKQIAEYIDEGCSLNDFESYKPLDTDTINKKQIYFYFLGYFLRWIPQEMYYFAVNNTDFKANTERTEGTYTKYASLDDKIDGFFYYTMWIKFGHGRAMSDSCSEVRHGHINKDEGKILINKFDGEYPQKYENEFYDYISMSKNEFLSLCDEFRPKHLWEKKSNRWVLKKTL